MASQRCPYRRLFSKVTSAKSTDAANANALGSGVATGPVVNAMLMSYVADSEIGASFKSTTVVQPLPAFGD